MKKIKGIALLLLSATLSIFEIVFIRDNIKPYSEYIGAFTSLILTWFNLICVAIVILAIFILGINCLELDK